MKRLPTYLTLAAVIVAVVGLSLALFRRPAGRSDRVAFDRPPYALGVKVGKTYDYSLNAHCGIRDARIDGTNWRATPPLGDGNPPRWWRGRGVGRLKVVTRDKAVYTQGNLRATFVRDNLPVRGCA